MFLRKTINKITQYLKLFTIRLMPRHFPIAHKLAIIMTILISTGMILLGIVIVNNQANLLHRQMHHFANTLVEQLADSSKELVMSDDMLSLMIITNNLARQENVLGAAIYSDNGNMLASSGITPSESIYTTYSQSTEDQGSHFKIKWTARLADGTSVQTISFITPIKFQNITAGHAVISFSSEEIAETINEMIQAIITATLIMIILGVFVSLHMGRRISRPINSLMDASKEISNGNYHYQIKEKRNDELGDLTLALNRMADGLLEKKQVENAFSRYVSKSIAHEIMANLDEIQLGGHHVEASVIFADIVGFTQLSEQHSAEEIADLLNEYFSYISIASKMYMGTIDKYMGDCAMIVFGVPENDSKHKSHAIYCAILIQKLMKKINAIRQQHNKITVTFRIGINSGPMLAGNLGSNDRMQYTVVGEAVNLASRLHHVAEKNQIIISSQLYDDPDIQWRIKALKHQSIYLRGIEEKISTYLVNDIIPLYRDEIENQIDEVLKIKPAA